MLRGFTPDGERDWCSCRWASTTTACWRTARCCCPPDAKRPGRARRAGNTLRFVANQLRLMLRSEWHRFGYACVNFGTPVSMRAWAAARGVDFDHLDRERRHAEVAALGHHLMAEVGRLIPVLPVPLVATVLLREPARPYSLFDLKSAVATLVARLEARGARLYVPRQDWDYAVGAGLRMLTQRHLVDEVDGLYSARASEQPLLRYYANSIAHLLAEHER